jgi:hypothetical protein
MNSVDEQLYRLVKAEGIMFRIKHTHNIEDLRNLISEYDNLMDDIVAFQFEEPDYKVNENGEFGAYY